jgi:hypothetical protein
MNMYGFYSTGPNFNSQYVDKYWFIYLSNSLIPDKGKMRGGTI